MVTPGAFLDCPAQSRFPSGEEGPRAGAGCLTPALQHLFQASTHPALQVVTKPRLLWANLRTQKCKSPFLRGLPSTEHPHQCDELCFTRFSLGTVRYALCYSVRLFLLGSSQRSAQVPLDPFYSCCADHLWLLCDLASETCTRDSLWRPAFRLLQLLCPHLQRSGNTWEFTPPPPPMPPLRCNLHSRAPPAGSG